MIRSRRFSMENEKVWCLQKDKNGLVKLTDSCANRFLSGLFSVLITVRLRLKIKKIKRKRKDLFRRIDSFSERAHVMLFKNLSPVVSKEWIRFYANVSGVSEYRYIPEDIYYSCIERRLNDINMSKVVSDKCTYETRYPGISFPYCFLRNISGTFLDSRGQVIRVSRARELYDSIREDVVVKPSIESGGGKNISFLSISEGLLVDTQKRAVSFDAVLERYRRNFVVQKKVRQHSFYASFHPASVNTLRVYTYRSVKDESVHILSAVLRIGRNGCCWDNQGKGGICVGINLEHGTLGIHAIDRSSGENFVAHPDTKVFFSGLHVPELKKVIACAEKIAALTISQRILSLDIAVTESNEVLPIEINTSDMGINLLQLHGKPLFGDFTDEVIEYCRNHKDEFKYFRSKR